MCIRDSYYTQYKKQITTIFLNYWLSETMKYSFLNVIMSPTNKLNELPRRSVMDYLTIANSPVFWGLCGITVLISLAQALLFMRQAKKAAVEVNLEKGRCV